MVVAVLEAYPTVFKGLRGLIHRFLAQVQLAAQEGCRLPLLVPVVAQA